MTPTLTNQKQSMTEPPLGTQAFIDDTPPRRARFDPPTNRDQMPHKPDGGLWTSTLQEDGSCAWLDWCQAERWGLTAESKLYALEPEPDISVFEIDRDDDLQRALAEWRRGDVSPVVARMFAPLDFEAMATEYDAIHLTEWGQVHTRHSHPSLYGWDTECTLWLRWSFRSVENCGPVRVGSDERDP